MIDAHFHYNMTGEKYQQSYVEAIEQVMQENRLKSVLLHIIDEHWYEKEAQNLCFPDSIVPSYLLNPLGNWKEELAVLAEKKVKFIKMLPYEQKIFREHYPQVLEMVQEIEKCKMCFVVCGSYGSEYVYDTNGVEIAAYLLKSGIKSPIVVAHGGMPRVFDCLSLMEVYPNLYMDLAFLNYWYGSTLIQDYVFVINKLKGERIFWGSDFPYMSLKESLDVFYKICEEYHICEDIKNNILSENFRKFCNNGW